MLQYIVFLFTNVFPRITFSIWRLVSCDKWKYKKIENTDKYLQEFSMDVGTEAIIGQIA